MSESELEPEPAAVKFAREFYELLDKAATVEEVDGSELRVWRGKLTEVFKELESSSKYYTPIRSLLTQSGAITIVEAGSRNRDSTVVLNHPLPTYVDLVDGGLTTAPSRATLLAIAQRVSALEGWRETMGGINIAEALMNMEQRIVKLESKAGGRNGKKS
jgi:hypothetical protein